MPKKLLYSDKLAFANKSKSPVLKNYTRKTPSVMYLVSLDFVSYPIHFTIRIMMYIKT